MAKSARNVQKSKANPVPTQVVDQRPVNSILPRSGESGDMTKPIRTVLYVEVQDLPASQVSVVCRDILGSFKNGHPHYVIPLRFGKLTSEFEFEGEFLRTVNELCEIADGKIVLKNGAVGMDVIRKKF